MQGPDWGTSDCGPRADVIHDTLWDVGSCSEAPHAACVGFDVRHRWGRKKPQGLLARVARGWRWAPGSTASAADLAHRGKCTVCEARSPRARCASTGDIVEHRITLAASHEVGGRGSRQAWAYYQRVAGGIHHGLGSPHGEQSAGQGLQLTHRSNTLRVHTCVCTITCAQLARRCHPVKN